MLSRATGGSISPSNEMTPQAFISSPPRSLVCPSSPLLAHACPVDVCGSCSCRPMPSHPSPSTSPLSAVRPPPDPPCRRLPDGSQLLRTRPQPVRQGRRLRDRPHPRRRRDGAPLVRVACELGCGLVLCCSRWGLHAVMSGPSQRSHVFAVASECPLRYRSSLDPSCFSPLHPRPTHTHNTQTHCLLASRKVDAMLSPAVVLLAPLPPAGTRTRASC